MSENGDSPTSEVNTNSSNFEKKLDDTNNIMNVLYEMMNFIKESNLPFLDGNKQKIITDWLNLNDK